MSYRGISKSGGGDTKKSVGGGWADLDRKREAKGVVGESGGMVLLEIIEARGLVQVDFDVSKFTRGKAKGGGSSDWMGVVRSRGPVNYPGQGLQKFRHNNSV